MEIGEVRFHQTAIDEDILFAIIVSRYKEKWIFCKHQSRETLECPGGHREPGESILQTARRELYEETGASDFQLEQVCPYSFSVNGEDQFGMLFFAVIKTLGSLPDFEIEQIELLSGMPEHWTYPYFQPMLVAEIKRRYQIED